MQKAEELHFMPEIYVMVTHFEQLELDLLS